MTAVDNPWVDYRVAARRVETDNVVTFTLITLGTAAKAGEHLIVRSPHGEDLRREYSLSAIRGDEVDITVKREGSVSAWLHDEVKPGDVIVASRPRGSFTLAESGRPLVLLSCGIGITPMMAMAVEALDRGREVRFVHVTGDRTRHALHAEVESLRSTRGLITHTTYKNSTDAVASGCDHVGEFTIAELKELLPDTGAEIKICGPQRFMQAMYDAAMELQIPESDVAWESFGPSTVVTTTGSTFNDRDLNESENVTTDSPSVHFRNTDMSVPWQPAVGNLLEFAEEQGVFPDFSCRQGSCESCVTRVLSGTFEYIDEPFMRPEEGLVLLCCSRPTSDIELDL